MRTGREPWQRSTIRGTQLESHDVVGDAVGEGNNQIGETRFVRHETISAEACVRLNRCAHWTSNANIGNFP
jgi:hypothetical protein